MFLKNSNIYIDHTISWYVLFQIFGFELNYATIVTTMAAIALAFATKVIITNIQVHPNTTDLPPPELPGITTVIP